jgi:glycosyltransferase involved in cell wall biosynthesis
MLNPDNRSWLDEFRKTHGRVPRVLHIGNIANNAYNNAKILNEAGLDNYVICYDYYHIMGCPEWEDADFSEFTGDHFKPAWFKLQLNGFTRPEWFIQGSFALCLSAFQSTILQLPNRQQMRAACLSVSSCVPPNDVREQIGPLLKLRLWMRRYRQNLRNSFRNKHPKAYRLACSLARKILSPIRWLVGIKHWSIAEAHVQLFRREFGITADPDTHVAIEAYKAEFVAGWGYPARNTLGRQSPLTRDDIAPYFRILSLWDKIAFRHCDFIVGYSTDPILPMLCGQEYFAFEHGTIREIPYQDTPQGRLTALAYRKARHVFVTNFDCRASADFLAPGRYTMINHPFDEDHGQRVTGWEELRGSLQQELNSDVLLFHPTRQDWVEGTGYADKANDLFLKAFCELRNQGLKIGLVCCEWGSNVPSSRQLIARAKCSEYVKWVQPLPVVAFERTCLACDVVVDQFKLGSFGGVLFKAMAVGRPILTFLDKEQVLQQYAESPPVLNCRTQKEITDAISRVFGQREELARLGKLSREWIKKHHGKAATVNAQVDQFRLFDLSRNQRGKSR